MWIQGHVWLYEQLSQTQYQYGCCLSQNLFPIHCVPKFGIFEAGFFITTSGPSEIATSPVTVPESLQEMRNMNFNLARRKGNIWHRWIRSVVIATYSFVISLSLTS
jgi:hypothetical protein